MVLAPTFMVLWLGFVARVHGFGASAHGFVAVVHGFGARVHGFVARVHGCGASSVILAGFRPKSWSPDTKKSQMRASVPLRELAWVRGFCRLGVEKWFGYRVLLQKPVVLTRRAPRGPAEGGRGGGKPPPDAL